MDTPILKALTNQVFLRHNAQVHHLPLHRQFSPWAGRNNVNVVHRSTTGGDPVGDHQNPVKRCRPARHPPIHGSDRNW